MSVALSRRSASYYQPGEGEAGPAAANVIICPNLDMGNLLYHLYAAALPRRQEVPGDLRPALPRRGPGHGLHPRGRPPGGQGQRAAHAPLRRVDADAAGTPSSAATASWPSTPAPPPPRSPSTRATQERFTQELQHSAEELEPFEGQPITAQFAFRKEAIAGASWPTTASSVADLDAVSGRGGLLWPIPHGTYAVNDAMAEDLLAGRAGRPRLQPGRPDRPRAGGRHAASPPSSSTRWWWTRCPSGSRSPASRRIRRKVISHALNQIATARRYAEENETFYEKDQRDRLPHGRRHHRRRPQARAATST